MKINFAARIAGLAAALLIGLGLTMIVAFHILSLREVDKVIHQDSTLASTRLEDLLKEKKSQLGDFATYAVTGVSRLRGLFLQTDAATEQAEAPRLAKDFAVDGVELTDEGGKTVARFGVSQDDPLPERGIVQQAIASGRTRAEIVARDGRLYAMAAAPVVNAGYTKGVLKIFREIGSTEVKRLEQELGVDVTFVVGDNVLGTSLPNFSRVSAPSSERIIIDGAEYAVKEQYVADTVPPNAFRVATMRRTDLVTAPYYRAEIVFCSVLAVALVISIAVAVIVGRGVSRPLDEVISSARAIQRGEWPEPFEKVRSDEIGVLQSAFNDMIASAKAAQNRLLAMLDIDPLTELANHRSFLEKLSIEAERMRLSDGRMCLVFFDLDRFKDYNQSHNPSAGDEVLRTVAQVLVRVCPENALISRYEGDRFAVLLPHTSTESGLALGEWVRQQLTGIGCPLTVSAGCAEFPKCSSQAEGLVLACEIALTRSKQLGRNQICAFDTVAEADGSADPFHLHAYMQNGSFATISALAAAVDAKDNYTQGHSERVAQYAADLGAYCGDSADEVERILRCGTLHDVGKIGVPDSILKKPGRLEPEEQRIMETHPALGEMIVGKVPQLAELLPGVRHHHERWDGRGYPDGLAGSNIPRIARLLALADTFDAMTSDRPYRKGMDVSIALAEIEKNTGAQFDPELAPKFVAMIREQLARAA